MCFIMRCWSSVMGAAMVACLAVSGGRTARVQVRMLPTAAAALFQSHHICSRWHLGRQPLIFKWSPLAMLQEAPVGLMLLDGVDPKHLPHARQKLAYVRLPSRKGPGMPESQCG